MDSESKGIGFKGTRSHLSCCDSKGLVLHTSKIPCNLYNVKLILNSDLARGANISHKGAKAPPCPSLK